MINLKNSVQRIVFTSLLFVPLMSFVSADENLQEVEQGSLTVIIKDRTGAPSERIFIVESDAGERFKLEPEQALLIKGRTGDRVSFVQKNDQGKVTLEEISILNRSK